MNNTEEMLIRAKEENAALRQRLAQAPHKENAQSGNVSALCPNLDSASAVLTPRTQQASFGGEGEEVRDLRVRLQILQTQYDHIAAKSGAGKGSSQKAEDELEVSPPFYARIC